MKRLKLIKVIASSLVAASVLALNPIGASAEWKEDSNGWWNSEGSLWSVGWKEIDGKWYYFNSGGYMVHDTIIDGYSIGSDGSWIQDTQNKSSSLGDDKKNITINNSTFTIDELVSILKTKFNNLTVKDVEEDFLPTTRKLITIDDESITVYVYNGNEEMEKDATNLINNNGSYEKTLANGEEVVCLDWTYAPHFYKNGKIIVQYCGENKTILSDLKAILGETFVGEPKSSNEQDVREIAYNQLTSKEKKSIKGTWKDGTITKMTLQESMGNISDKSYVGKEVYSISFPMNVKFIPNEICVLVGIDSYKIIGYGYLD
ncbi:putative cell wall binding repeat protein [Clostridium saccharobutylicum]|uniref:Putative cell wall binding repeat protein n=1 Tax=Clostridium saccharobutylicum DSM 13864 TaxID=1345695 RepID=U5MUZ8_CLOSA|nr:putative cell wall binding repeat protein [Clostridium saccharobutylicum]AGX44385.1 putative cell wall binding repeat protein [Clostridium saccharobutylicum DSM 13864]AQR91677.1 hypothetical protein CLOSC_34030 [Clostridium saccharobutylicum]AQS01581.1 hypothetical protein CSACC_34100 [Clostridium saccharobutylicum]AQS15564.1 hypothetical protein CLOSACC_34100 [Clostridium saccharobutylicum]MBA2907281.1 hypothetical protein [Clostridium saccharobutylicum]